MNLIKSIMFLQKYLIGTDKIRMKPDSEKTESVLHSFVLPFGSLLLLAVSRALIFSQFAGVLSVVLRLTDELLSAAEVEG